MDASVAGRDTLGEACREVGAPGRGGVLRGGGVLRACLEDLVVFTAVASLAPAGCDGGCCFRLRELPFDCEAGLCSGGVGAGVAAPDCPGVLSPGLFLFTTTGVFGAGSFPLRCLRSIAHSFKQHVHAGSMAVIRKRPPLQTTSKWKLDRRTCPQHWYRPAITLYII